MTEEENEAKVRQKELMRTKEAQRKQLFKVEAASIAARLIRQHNADPNRGTESGVYSGHFSEYQVVKLEEAVPVTVPSMGSRQVSVDEVRVVRYRIERNRCLWFVLVEGLCARNQGITKVKDGTAVLTGQCLQGSEGQAYGLALRITEAELRRNPTEESNLDE